MTCIHTHTLTHTHANTLAHIHIYPHTQPSQICLQKQFTGKKQDTRVHSPSGSITNFLTGSSLKFIFSKFFPWYTYFFSIIAFIILSYQVAFISYLPIFVLQSLIFCKWNIFFFCQFEDILFSSVQSLSCVQLFGTPWTAACQASLSITNSWSLLKLISVESVIPSNHLILCRPLLLLPSIFPSIRVFSKESALHIRWPKYWSFSFSISPSNEYSGLISFRMDWLNLLAVQGTFKSLVQYHTSKASILRCSAFFIV